MADARSTAAYLCGKLYATLWALGVLGTAAPTPSPLTPGRDESTARFPRDELKRRLAAAGAHMITAKGRGGDRAQAASEVFRSIPDLIPVAGLPQKRYTNQEVLQFSQGCAAQLTTYREKYGSLLH
ncbi:hypothetical protein ABZ070_33515 [Streptomyces sp. NPDC006283]|uniref:hypothetical protein n=1 Tax=Streptomyces sp. NPDC006283 TaxID=3156741 RepID=UPI0033B81A12